MKTYQIFLLFALLGLSACGGSGGGGSSDSTVLNSQEMQEATPGVYYALLRPVNFHSNGFIPYGAATFTLKGDQLLVETSMDDDQRVPHRQSLHVGNRCPSKMDDTNGDGLIDYNEALAVVGKVLMPLDNDINSQLSGYNFFPSGTSMTYSRVGSLSKINADLWLNDENPSDEIIKLQPGTSIGFENRVVLIHGTTPQSFFPVSLSSYPGEAAHLSLPVVCGVLKKN